MIMFIITSSYGKVEIRLKKLEQKNVNKNSYIFLKSSS